MATAKKKTPATRKSINLALQGGGAHGAFAWGAIDTLLADGRIDIEAISATSAGAMNAVVFTYGFNKGGQGAGSHDLRGPPVALLYLLRKFDDSLSELNNMTKVPVLPVRR